MRKRKTEVSALPAVDADENGGVAIAEGEERVELSALRENPDNPQTVTEEEFGKLRDSMRRIHGFLRTRPLLVEEDGTIKSFYSVMAAPSCVRISMLRGGTTDTAQHWRIHHQVKWENCAAKIISARWRKGSGGR